MPGLSEKAFERTLWLYCYQIMRPQWKGAVSGRALAPLRHALSFLDYEVEA